MPARWSSVVRAMRLRSLGWIVTATSGSSSSQSASGPRSAISRSTCGADLRRNRRAQVQVRQCRSQVEPRAADDDRSPPVGDELVDLLVRQRGEASGAELSRGVDEAHEPVLEPRRSSGVAAPLSVSRPR